MFNTWKYLKERRYAMVVEVKRVERLGKSLFLNLNGCNNMIEITEWFLEHKGIDIKSFKQAKKLDIKTKGDVSLGELTQTSIDSIRILE